MKHKVNKQRKKHWRGWFIAFLVILVYIWAFQGLPFAEIKSTAGEVTASIFSGLLHPDWNYVYDPEGEDLLRGLLDTLCIALLGTVIAAILGIPFAFWAANNLSRRRWVSGSGKVFFSIVRTLPELILALIFVVAVGPGSYAGVLALAFHSFGMLGKLYAEAIESIDFGPAEALAAAGATRLQILWFAILPQVFSAFLSQTIYRFELNVRAASILGMIGAGGIGTPLLFALSTRHWERVGIILLGIILMVTMIDLLSGHIRKKLA